VIFLDTGFLFAFVSEDDENHSRVDTVLEEHRGRRLSEVVLTTNHVVAETITLCRNKGHRDPRVRHERAVRVRRQLRSGAFGRVHHATPEEEQAAFEYFEQHADKDYSFVDCLSFVIMRKLGINEAWAVDSDFRHHGFLVQPGPRPRT
jgi:predicted nucleic acid-binding protein